MDFIECEKPLTAMYCTDNDCNCTVTPIENGHGYIYVSQEVVEFRKDALTLAAVQAKIEQLSKNGEYISVTKYSPILICEQAAKKRNLNLNAASEDAILWWSMNQIPLRPTPLASAESAPVDLYSPPPPFQTAPPPIPVIETPPIPVQVTPPPIPAPQATWPIEEPVKPKVENPSFQKIESVPFTPAPYDDPPPTPLIAPTMMMSKNDFMALKAKASAPTPPSPPPLPASPPPMPPMPSQSTKDLSVNDVVAEYSSGPLAEMARKMASDLNSENSELSKNAIPPAKDPNKTVITTINKPNYSNNRDQAVSPSKSANATQVYSLKDMPKRSKNSSILKPLLIIGIPVLLLLISISIFIIIMFSDKPKQTPVVNKPLENIDYAVLDKSFFLNSYTLQDDNYNGTISFSDINGISGKYTQQLRSKLKNKTSEAHGDFTFSPQRITFRPDGNKGDIVWILDDIDTAVGNAIFHDIKVQNGKEVNIYFKKSF